jgi:alkylated DNA repair dioxygenase AlkB
MTSNDFEYITRKEAETMAPDAPDVVLVPGFLSREEADALLERIRSGAEFRQNYIQLYGRKAIPRLEAWYGSWDYPYSKGIVLKAAPMPGYLQDVICEISALGFGEFNAVLINRYRNGKDYISPHSDDDYGDPEPTIRSLTLGATRPFRLARMISGSKLDRSTMGRIPAGTRRSASDARSNQFRVAAMGAQNGQANRRAHQSDVPHEAGAESSHKTGIETAVERRCRAC